MKKFDSDDLFQTIMEQVADIRNRKQIFGRAKETGQVINNLRSYVRLHVDIKKAEKIDCLPKQFLPESKPDQKKLGESK